MPTLPTHLVSKPNGNDSYHAYDMTQLCCVSPSLYTITVMKCSDCSPKLPRPRPLVTIEQCYWVLVTFKPGSHSACHVMQCGTVQHTYIHRTFGHMTALPLPTSTLPVLRRWIYGECLLFRNVFLLLPDPSTCNREHNLG